MYRRKIRVSGFFSFASLWVLGMAIIWKQGIVYGFDLVGGDVDKRTLEFSDMSRDQESSSSRTVSSLAVPNNARNHTTLIRRQNNNNHARIHDNPRRYKAHPGMGFG